MADPVDVIIDVESPSISEIVSVSSENSDDISADPESEASGPESEDEISNDINSDPESEASGPESGDEIPEVDDVEEETARAPRVFTSGTQICRLFDNPRLPQVPPPAILFSAVPSTHVGRRVYTIAALDGPVVPERVGTIRRGDNWNGRPDPKPDDPEDPIKYNLQPYAASQPHSVSIPASLGLNRKWDS